MQAGGQPRDTLWHQVDVVAHLKGQRYESCTCHLCRTCVTVNTSCTVTWGEYQEIAAYEVARCPPSCLRHQQLFAVGPSARGDNMGANQFLAKVQGGCQAKRWAPGGCQANSGSRMATSHTLGASGCQARQGDAQQRGGAGGHVSFKEKLDTHAPGPLEAPCLQPHPALAVHKALRSAAR